MRDKKAKERGIMNICSDGNHIFDEYNNCINCDMNREELFINISGELPEGDYNE